MRRRLRAERQRSFRTGLIWNDRTVLYGNLAIWLIGRRGRLTRNDWIQAAIALGTEVGFDRIAVDALAPRLGATRGSFYWHFTDRAALIDAVLQTWEEQATAAVIAAQDGRSTADALERVIATAFGASDEEDAAEWRLITAADDPYIGPVVARVHRRREAFLRELLLRRGVAPHAAPSEPALPMPPTWAAWPFAGSTRPVGHQRRRASAAGLSRTARRPAAVPMRRAASPERSPSPRPRPVATRTPARPPDRSGRSPSDHE